MRPANYEYNPSDKEDEIPEERKEELIIKLKKLIRKDTIAHYHVLNIGKNDAELDFLYDWLDDHDIQIRGINGTISGEIPNFTHIPKMGQSLTPDTLSEEEQLDLFRKLQTFSDEDKRDPFSDYFKIRNKLIEHNMRLAQWMLTWEGIRRFRISEEDKKQMAYIGLVFAVEKFDPSKGYKFSTYASKAIYRRIIREIYRDSREFRQSYIVSEQLEMIAEVENQILVSLGREAKSEELSDILGIPVDRIGELKRLRSMRAKESLEQISSDRTDLETVAGELSDSDTITNSSEGHIIIDGVYRDEKEELPVGFRRRDRVEDAGMVQELQIEIGRVLGTLTPKEEQIIRLRFGLDGRRPQTLREVAKHFGVSPGRISQVELKALRKLMYPSRSKRLKPFMDLVGENRDEEEHF